MTGIFIAFEGGDSVGKSTQVERLALWLETRGIAHVVTRQPGGTPVGAELRRLVLDHSSGDVSARAEALMYAADKAQHVYELIGPALARGDVVISDRYVDSMIAYQGAGRALAIDEVSSIAWWAVGQLRPHLTILLDADPADAVETIAEKDRLEDAGIELHRRARHFFLDLAAADPERYLVLNARLTRDELASTIAARVAEHLASR